MGRGRSKKKLVFEIPEPGMADADDELPIKAPKPEPAIEEVIEAKPKKRAEPEKEYPDHEYWRQDGKQYDISLQDSKEKNKFKSFDETDNLADAKSIAHTAAFEEGRIATVWDRKLCGVCCRIDPNSTDEEDEKPSRKK